MREMTNFSYRLCFLGKEKRDRVELSCQDWYEEAQETQELNSRNQAPQDSKGMETHKVKEKGPKKKIHSVLHVEQGNQCLTGSTLSRPGLWTPGKGPESFIIQLTSKQPSPFTGTISSLATPSLNISVLLFQIPASVVLHKYLGTSKKTASKTRKSMQSLGKHPGASPHKWCLLANPKQCFHEHPKHRRSQILTVLIRLK